jgi:DNA-binding PadR family transcriptional regulator
MASELTPRHVQILLVLAEAPSHGYLIGKEIEARTGGAVVLKPGSMYRALHQLLELSFIEEIETGGSDDERRREYRVTQPGRRALRDALEDYRDLVQAGERLRVIRGGGR